MEINMERAMDDKTRTPTYCLMRWYEDIEQWQLFSCGDSDQELRGPTARAAGKGYDGPWVLIRSGQDELRFKNTRDLFDWMGA
jgi:hypothetical protein